MAESMEQHEQREKQWSAWWYDRMKLVVDDGTRTTKEREAAALREKRNWWRYTFGEEYVEKPKAAPAQPAFMEQPVLFACAQCELFFTNRASCNEHAKLHGGPPAEAKVLFHPRATELELKACLFVNLPLADRAMLSPTVRSSDMDLCYVTKRLVLREPCEEDEWPDTSYDGRR
jgi:hypothetical protein